MSSRSSTQSPLAVSFARAAEITSLSKNTLRRFAKSGRLRTVRLGRRRLIPFEALNELIRGGNEIKPIALEKLS